ncbi:hypothetical protein EDB84DRAFT_1565272 [Lactarius hengduanensis]|nr:hypothetical protein EDB84DRAFT_1565272 [Lactarius hengduanensis]
MSIYAPSLFLAIRLSLCAFMSILNSRDNLRETLDGPGGVVTFTQLKVRTGTTVPWGRKIQRKQHRHGCSEESSTSFGFLDVRHVVLR